MPQKTDPSGCAQARNGARLSDQDVLAIIQSDTPLNRVRRQISFASARIEQVGLQRQPPSPIELRRFEIEAAIKVAAELGIDLDPRSLKTQTPEP